MSDKLFATATSPSLLATHRVAAWNTLCAFVDELACSKAQTVRELLWSQGVWLSAGNLYIKDSQHSRPKSAKQLLVTLGNALRKNDDLCGMQRYIVECVPGHLESDGCPRQTKAFLQLLTQFFSKDLIEPSAINTALLVEPGAQNENGTRPGVDGLLSCLFRWASYDDLGSVASRCISVVLDKHNEALARQNSAVSTYPSPAIWISALEDCLQTGTADIDQLRIHVFPVLFEGRLPDYTSFLCKHGLDELSDIPRAQYDERDEQGSNRLLLAALQSGKELGLVYETDQPQSYNDGSALYIPIQAYSSLLSSPDRGTRITGLSLVVFSHSATRPFLAKALKLFRRSLPPFFADTDANFRGEVFSLMQRLMHRLRAITAVLARTTGDASHNSESDSQAQSTLRQHRAFVEWLLRFLTWELRPTASYQRHISALKSLLIVARSGIDSDVPSSNWSKSATAETKWPFSFHILNAELQQLLLGLLMDPFDDVRQTASSILSLYARSPAPNALQHKIENLNSTIEQAEKVMLATGRADQADGVAHMYSLLAKAHGSESDLHASDQPPSLSVISGLLADLERMLENAQASLMAAAKRYPMHGLLTSIRFILAQQASRLLEEESSKLIHCLRRVWDTVKPVLCNDAPEGYELEDAGELAESSSKDTLSYCWRALKESSLLLGVLVADKTISRDTVTGLANLCFSQLSELRHRGAFSTVAQTWVVCCQRAAVLPSSEEPNRLLQQWYQRAFDILRNKTTINTRRSAGIPSLLCGLLIADKTANFLPRAFEDLSLIAKEPVDTALTNESSLPQVHALNCIKEILKNTRLGEQSERFVPVSLRLAADSLRSEAWAIRNCGLMLFRGVIDRLLGTSDAYLEDDVIVRKRISASQHPGLLDTVLQLLIVPTSEGPTTRFEGVFPALQMLQHMEISPTQQQQAQEAVLALTASTSWHVRDKAARTYAALVSVVESPAPFDDVLASRLGDKNAVHGALLCLKYMTRAVVSLEERGARKKSSARHPSETLLRTTVPALDCAWKYEDNFAHSVTRAAWIDALVEYFQLHRRASQDVQLRQVLLGLNLSPTPDFFDRLCWVIETVAAAKPEKALERASLAKGFACLLVAGKCPLSQREDHESPVDVIISLGREDADACAEFWQALRTEIDVGGKLPPEHMEGIVLPAAERILSDDFPMRLKCEAQKFLLSVADNGSISDDFVKACSVGTSPLTKDSNQTYADQWLQLHASVLDSRLHSNAISPAGLSSFLHTCKAAVGGDGLSSREAAALALSRMQHLWLFLSKHENSSLACTAYPTIYDLLNDDDEDLRLLAARITSRILRSTATSRAAQQRQTHCEPITAIKHLLTHMLSHLQHSRSFAREAFKRAFNVEETVVDQLHTFSQPDTALFAQEKQNLYIDPAREVRAWSQVLLRLPVTTRPKYWIRDVTGWVDEGLYTLTSQLRKGNNGALGWSSKPETFVLGLQVIYGVEVLFAYLEKGGKLPMEGSEVLRRLCMFSQALEKKGGNVLWKWEVERVLGGIVEGRVRLAWGLAGTVREMARTLPSA